MTTQSWSSSSTKTISGIELLSGSLFRCGSDKWSSESSPSRSIISTIFVLVDGSKVFTFAGCVRRRFAGGVATGEAADDVGGGVGDVDFIVTALP